ncbi:MAG: class I SAM-dependent methyltransferase [Promethearchaeota archaeon]
MPFSNNKVKEIFDKEADNLLFWYLDTLFTRATENSRYRKKAIKFLNITPESSIIDIACGTGFNFKIIESYLNKNGMLIGLDISPRSLEYANGRINKNNWTNAKLVSINIRDYNPTIQFDAVICTYAISIIPDYIETIDKMYNLLKKNGRLAIVGMKISSRYPFKLLNSYIDNYYLKWGINIHRPIIKYLKSKPFKFEFYEDCHFGFEYILVLKKVA